MDKDCVLAQLVTPFSCNDGNGNSAQEGSGDGTSTLSIASCSRDDDNDGGGGANDGALGIVGCTLLVHQ
jgi:hypothetical protein